MSKRTMSGAESDGNVKVSAALVTWAAEAIPTSVPMQIVRATIDLMRPVPVAPLTIGSEVLREGRKIQLCAVSLLANNVVVVRATVLKVRVRAIAEGGEANRAVTELLAKVLGVPKAKVRLLSGVTSRLKQIAIDGDPAKLGDTLRKVTAATHDRTQDQKD